MALRFSFFDRVLGMAPQLVWLSSVESFQFEQWKFTISRLGQYYSLAGRMSSPSASIRRTALSTQSFLDVSPFNTTRR